MTPILPLRSADGAIELGQSKPGFVRIACDDERIAGVAESAARLTRTTQGLIECGMRKRHSVGTAATARCQRRQDGAVMSSIIL